MFSLSSSSWSNTHEVQLPSCPSVPCIPEVACASQRSPASMQRSPAPMHPGKTPRNVLPEGQHCYPPLHVRCWDCVPNSLLAAAAAWVFPFFCYKLKCATSYNSDSNHKRWTNSICILGCMGRECIGGKRTKTNLVTGDIVGSSGETGWHQ